MHCPRDILFDVSCFAVREMCKITAAPDGPIDVPDTNIDSGLPEAWDRYTSSLAGFGGCHACILYAMCFADEHTVSRRPQQLPLMLR